MGVKGDRRFQTSDLVKNLNRTDINPCGEFRWIQEGPVSQIHSPHLHIEAPGNFSDISRSVQMLESGVWKAMGSYHPYLSLIKLQPWFLSLQWTTCLWTELQLWFLHLQWKTCPWEEHSDYDDDYYYLNYVYMFQERSFFKQVQVI